MRIKAVLSDAGNVLFADQGIKQAEWQRVVQVREIPFGEFYRRFQQFHKRAQVEADYSREQALADYAQSLGFNVSDLPPAKKEKKEIKLFDGVAGTLEQIHSSGRRFIILTDATKPGAKLFGYINRLGIGEYVHDLLSSKDVGHIKPAPEFFDIALEKHGLEREDVLFVGHDFDELYGAHQYGLEVVAFNHNPNADLSFIPDENKIDAFAQLLDVISRYEEQ